MLGCKLARRYPDRITVDFFGDQLVCHLTEGMSAERPASLYPRHFGVTFRDEADFEALHACAVLRKIAFYQEVSPGSRAWWRSTTRSCCSTRRGTCWSSSITVIRG
jgi:Predicted dioxygenase of extradiol dioxygenase family